MLDALRSWDAPLTEKLVRQMYELANTRLEASAFLEQCRGFGWNVHPTTEDDPVYFVEIGDELPLHIGREGNQVTCAILRFHHWEEYEEEWHKSPKTYRQEKESFIAAYDQSLCLVEKELGAPLYCGQDADEDAHRYALWRGSQSMFILQQAAFDVQFGLEINIWLEPLSQFPNNFQPTSPFIAWLSPD